MPDTKRPSEQPADKKNQGKFHYNPGNMAGKEAGILKEHEPEEERQREGNVNDEGARPVGGDKKSKKKA